MEKNYFTELNSVDVNKYVEKKNGLTYLSWAWAISETLKRFPDMSYEVKKFADENGNLLPYMFDKETGFMVMTSVTINNITREMWLPVMDGQNKAMLKEPYEFETKFGNKKVEKATMFDVNKTIMRCLVKNIAMFGLGLYIYAGEDLPEANNELEIAETEKIFSAKDIAELNKFCSELLKSKGEGFRKQILVAYNARKKELNSEGK